MRCVCLHQFGSDCYPSWETLNACFSPSQTWIELYCGEQWAQMSAYRCIRKAESDISQKTKADVFSKISLKKDCVQGGHLKIAPNK